MFLTLETNAGLSYESADKPGHFSEVYFFDQGLEMPIHGQVQENVYFYKYWLDSMDGQFEFRKKPKSYRPFDPCQRRRGRPQPQRSHYKEEKKMQLAQAGHLAQVFSECEEEEEEEEMELAEEDTEEEEGTSDSDSDDGDSDDEMESYALNCFIDFAITDAFYGCTFISHYGAKYDHYLLLRALLRRNIECQILADGNKLLQIFLPEVLLTFIDSYKFLQIPLDG